MDSVMTTDALTPARPSGLPVLRLDDMGKRIAAKRTTTGKRAFNETEDDRNLNRWVAAMYESMEAGGIRVKQLLIDRTKS